MKNWKKVSVFGDTKIGALLFKNFFSMCPDVMDYFDFSKDPAIKKQQYLELGTKMAKKINDFVTSMSDPQELMAVCKSLKDIHVSIQITPV